MPGKLIDGKAESGLVRAELKAEIDAIRQDAPSFRPGLAIVQVPSSLAPAQSVRQSGLGMGTGRWATGRTRASTSATS